MESKLRFKMYKDGKKWVVAGVVTAAMGLGMVNFAETNVHADTTTATTSVANSNASTSSSGTVSVSSAVNSNSQAATSATSFSSVSSEAKAGSSSASSAVASSTATSSSAVTSSSAMTSNASSAKTQSSAASSNASSTAVSSQAPQKQVKMLAAAATTPQTIVDSTPATSVTWALASGGDFYIPTAASGSFIVPTDMAVGDRIDMGTLTVTGKTNANLTPQVTSAVPISGIGTFDGRYITLTSAFNTGQVLNYSLNPIVFGSTAHVYTDSTDMATYSNYLGVTKTGAVAAVQPVNATNYYNGVSYYSFTNLSNGSAYVAERANILTQAYFQSALNGNRDTSLLVQPTGNYVLVQKIPASDVPKITSVNSDIDAWYSSQISPDGTHIVSDNNGDGYSDKTYVEPGVANSLTRVDPSKDESAADIINTSAANTWGYVINSDGSMTAYLNTGALADISVTPAQISNAILNQQWAGTQAGVTAAQATIAANPAFASLYLAIAYHSTPGENITINSTTSDANGVWNTSSILVPSGSTGTVTPTPQVVGVQYVDDNNGGAVVGSGLTNSTGLAGNSFTYTAPTNSDGSLADPASWVPTTGLSSAAANLANYTLDPNYSSTVTGVYDAVDDTNGPSQFVTIHLKHAIATVNQSVTDTVHYVGAGTATPADNVQTINYDQNTDQVTGNISYVPVNQALIVTTPDLTKQGYTPSSTDPSGYNPEAVNFGTATTSTIAPVDNQVTVTYVPIDYTLTTNYVDGNNNVLAPAVTQNNKTVGTAYTTSSQVIDGYYLTATPSNATGTFGAENVVVNYVYAKMGSLVPTPSNPKDPNWPGTPSTQYPNNPTDPTQPGTVNIPDVPGYTPVDGNGNPLQPGTPITPSNPGTNTDVKYVPIDYTLTVNYQDADGNVLAPTTMQANENMGDKYTTTAKVIDGYYLTATPSNASGKFGTDNITVTYVYAKLGNFIPTPSNPNDPNWPNTPSSQYPNNPSNPSEPGKIIIPNVPGYTPVDGNGNPLKPGTPITPSNPGTDTNVKYVPINYTLTVRFVDQNGKQVVPQTIQNNETIGTTYQTMAKVIKGYYLKTVPTNANGKFGAGNIVVTYVYAKMGQLVPNVPGVPGVIYPNDPNNPSGAGNPLIPNIPGYTPVDGNGNPLKPGTPYPINPNEPGVDTLIHYVKDKTPTPSHNNQPSIPNKGIPTKPQQPTAPNKVVNTTATKTSVPATMSRVALHHRQVAKPATPADVVNRLPQTGESTNNEGEVVGLSILGLMGAGMSVLGLKKRKH